MSDRPIVVGFDGSEEARAALNWALAEARRCHHAVHLVHVLDGLELRTETEAGVERVAAGAAESRPQIPVSWVVLDGNPAGTLCELSDRAEMIVLGQRGAGGFRRLVLGSVATAVATHARCTVVVVRGDLVQRWPPPPVVVGVDDSRTTRDTVGFAVEEAACRGVGLIAIRAWDPPPPPWHTITRPLTYDVAEIETAERSVLERAVDRWRDKYPYMRMDLRLMPGTPGKALVAASRDAQLVAVGARGRGGFVGLLLGSVSLQLLHHAHCPVALVR